MHVKLIEIKKYHMKFLYFNRQGEYMIYINLNNKFEYKSLTVDLVHDVYSIQHTLLYNVLIY